MATTLQFLNVILVGLISGAIMGIWIGYNPQHFSYPTYVEHQQEAIRSLNTLMPMLGIISIILTIVNAYLQKTNRLSLSLLIIAAILLIISGLITRFGNQPINTVVMTWNPAEPPANWQQLRDKWFSYHIIRSCASVLSFILIVISVIAKGGKG